MFRLILLVLFVLVAALAVRTVTRAARQAGAMATQQIQEDTMTNTIRRLSYVALIVLMFGVTSGWLGAS